MRTLLQGGRCCDRRPQSSNNAMTCDSPESPTTGPPTTDSGPLGFQEVLSKRTKRTRKRLEEQAEIQHKMMESAHSTHPQPKSASASYTNKPSRGGGQGRRSFEYDNVTLFEGAAHRKPPVVEGPIPLLDELDLLRVKPASRTDGRHRGTRQRDGIAYYRNKTPPKTIL